MNNSTQQVHGATSFFLFKNNNDIFELEEKKNVFDLEESLF